MFKSESKLKYVLIALVIIGLAYFLVLCFIPKYSITGQLLRQEQSIARAEAENIQSFVEGIGRSLTSISQHEDIIDPGPGTTAVMKSFVDEWGENNLITGISLTDKDGVVIHNYSNLSPTKTGISIADRDYFIWAKAQVNSDNYIVGQTIIARYGVNEGKYITPVAVPVFKDGVFSGMLASSVRTAEMTKYYLSLMNVSDTTDAYILGKDGYLLYSRQLPERVKEDLYESKRNILFSDNKNLNKKIYSALSKEKEGVVVATYLDPNSGKMEEHALAYSPVVMPGRHWLVILATPATEVTKASMPIYVQQISAVLFLALVIFSAGIIFLRKK